MVEAVKKTKKEFFEFLKDYNAIQLAVGVVLGNAVKDLVNSLVNGLIMPIFGIISPGGSWRELVYTIGGSEFKIGEVIGSLINFLIIALVVFIVIKKLFRIDKIGK